jgi:hypothetical protein
MKSEPRRATFYVWMFFAGFITFILHEAAHWIAGTTLGYNMEARLNGVKATTTVLLAHAAVIDAAGPLVTILQAFGALAAVLRYHSNTAFVFLYAAAFMRLLATAVSVFHPNDEARLSMYFGLGKWTLPIIVSASLLLLTWKASRYLKLTWKEHFLCYVTASISISLIIVMDRFF